MLPQSSIQRRVDRLRGLLEREQLDALLVTSAPNRRYLSGFTGSAGSLIVTRDRALLLSDFRYQEQAGQEAPGWEFRLVKPPEMPQPKLVATVASELGLASAGFEADDVSVALHDKLQGVFAELAPAAKLRATEGLVGELRVVKDADELATLRRAIAITDGAFASVRSRLRPEMRERDVAWELEKAMREAGAHGLAFPIIVAAGANGARPHARAGDEQLGVGRTVTMDFGALVDGYHADMTRTVILGEAGEKFAEVYRTVLDAHEHAAAHIRPGMIGKDADALARERIAAAGYGEHFGHGLGHGVGLQIHEGPWVNRSDEEALPVGAVFSVEPGIYLPGWGGVRIEDLVVLGEDGTRRLTGASKDPLVLLD